jgi:hypothetical protein
MASLFEQTNNSCPSCLVEIPQSQRVVLDCGHMACVSCDIAWRSKGKIETVIVKRGSGTSFFMLTSTCMICRDKNTPSSYFNRSKESLIQEIQMLSRTLYMSNVKTPKSVLTGFDLSLLARPTVAAKAKLPSPVMVTTERAAMEVSVIRDIERQNFPVVQAPLPVLQAPLPVVPAPRPAPVLQAPLPIVQAPAVPAVPALVVPNPVYVLDIGGSAATIFGRRPVSKKRCIRNVRGLGCTTETTKLTCNRCFALLCRSCKDQCPEHASNSLVPVQLQAPVPVHVLDRDM